MFILVLSVLVCAAADTPQQRYIDKYAPTAVREMYRSGVPASITLAQGMLESRYGLSPLATKGNNHFGIKCFDWKGRTMKYDDDRKDECFRVYGSADESFRDHSDFLRYSKRYHFLFDYNIMDYKAWAHGLKKAGYATDPKYPSKLIRIIEEYKLTAYDRMKPSDFPDIGSAVTSVADGTGSRVDKEVGEGESAPEEKILRRSKKERRVRVKKIRGKSTVPAEPEVIPESPTVLEEPERYDSGAHETMRFSLSRQVYSKNGVPFVYSEEGDTYLSIAESNNLFPKEILRINDLEAEEELAPGTVVYLQAKKKQSRKGLDKFIVERDGTSLRDICQEYAVRMSSVMKMNGFEEGHVLREGDTVLLRK